MAKANITHREVVDSIRKKEYLPIYLLMGEESYYIDRISDYIADSVLTKEEQDFNLQIIYCTRETNVADIINSARRYPMMAEHQVIIVKEAQNLLKFDDIAVYALKPQPSTILVLCYKHGTVDRRKKVIPAIEKVGMVFESSKLKDGMLPQFISDYLKRKGLAIDAPAAQVIAESVGSDLNRMAGELDKLALALPEGVKCVNTDHVEENIGISKEFNMWELRNAVVAKDVAKANKILFHFEQNPKANSPVATVAMLFNFFAQVMLAYYSPDKSEQGLMKYLDLRQTWQLRDFNTAMKNFTATKTMRIIGKLRETDAKLKGIEKGSLTDEDVMHELLYFILH